MKLKLTSIVVNPFDENQFILYAGNEIEDYEESPGAIVIKTMGGTVARYVNVPYLIKRHVV